MEVKSSASSYGHRHYSSDLTQGVLEIPCLLKFISNDKKELVKAEKLLESALNVKSMGISKHLSLNLACVMPVNRTSNSMPLACKTKCEAQENENMSPNSFMDLTKDLDVESPPTKKQNINDYERIILGEELSDIKINYAQQLLKVHYPKFSGFHSTLLQGRVKGSANNIQIVHYSTKHHWITATTMNCKLGEVKVYDSLFTYCDKETVKVIHDMYQDTTEKLTITVCHSQKQRGGKDCGLFAITFAVSLVFGLTLSRP